MEEFKSIAEIEKEGAIQKIDIKKDSILEKAKRLVVDNDEKMVFAIQGLKIIKELKSIAKEKETFFIGPVEKTMNELRSHVKIIKGFFVNLVAPLNEADKMIKNKIADYNVKKQEKEEARLREIEREKERIEQEKRKAAEANKKVSPKIKEKERKVIELGKQATEIFKGFKDEGITVFTRKEWVYEVLDIEKIPEPYVNIEITVNRRQVMNAILREGVRKIPGLKIFEKVSTQTR
jgi:hypothetical protein